MNEYSELVNAFQWSYPFDLIAPAFVLVSLAILVWLLLYGPRPASR